MGSWYFGFYFRKEHTSDCWKARIAKQEKEFCFYHIECMVFLYRGFNIVHLFLPKVCDSLF